MVSSLILCDGIGIGIGNGIGIVTSIINDQYTTLTLMLILILTWLALEINCY